MEAQQREVSRLRQQLDFLQNEHIEMQNIITSLEKENEEKDKMQANAEKTNEGDLAELNEEINELESKVQEYQEVISNLRQASLKNTEEHHINVATDNSEESNMLEAEKQEALKAYLELQEATEGLGAQNMLLENETSELSSKVSELESELAVMVEECRVSYEKLEDLQEEQLSLKVKCETLKGKVGNSALKGNSLFAEVEDGRQQLKNEAKEQKEQLVALQKTYSQTSLEIRKLMKENAKISEQLEYAREQGSTEELMLQLTTCKQSIEELEAAQKKWEEEAAAGPIVLGQDDETGTFYDNLLKEEREKTKQVYGRYKDIISRYIAATVEVAAIKRETAIMESKQLRAEAELLKLKLELLKSEEDNHKKEVLKMVTERYPFKEMQNVRKSRNSADTVEPSTRKLVAKKEVDKITHLTSSLNV